MTNYNTIWIFIIGILLIGLCFIPAVSADAFSAFSAYGDAWKATNDTYTIVKWNSTGTHSWLSTGNASTISYLVIGGGAGGGYLNGGGGGAGGFWEGTGLAVSGSKTITVGGGGAGGTTGVNGTSGSLSSIGTDVIAPGGGGGGSYNGRAGVSATGASGGGANWYSGSSPGGINTGGHGYAGSAGYGSGDPSVGGGGGGAGQAGQNVTGGNGLASSITGTSVTYAAGGGGGSFSGGRGLGGSSGIGGDGGNNEVSATAGDTNTGSGGGGGGQGTGGSNGAAGGSGIVIIQYATLPLPAASFTQNKTSGQAPLDVLFTDTSTNRPMFWNWSINSTDWSSRTWYNYTVSTNLVQTFTTPGIYNITLSVQNLTVSTDISTVQHDVQVNSTLIADFIGSPLYGFAPLDVSFVDFSVGGGIYAWNWSFGDGTVSTLQNPTHTYNSEGLKTILLIVTGADGTNQTTRSDYVEVRYKTYSDFYANNTAPIAFEQPVLFTPFLNTSADRYLWDWGEGGAPFLSLNGSAWHIYTSIGPKTVNLTAYRSDNLTATNTTSKVAYVTPTYNASYVKANFTATPTTGGVGLAVVFTDLSEFGTPGGQTYNWSFGDDYLSTNPYSNTVGSISHVYTALGTYTVTLTVNNTLGIDNETKLSYITVSNQQSTTFYSPKTTAFHIVDQYGNQIKGATVTANFNQSNLPPTTTTWLVSNYGMNINAANEALNGALMMSGLSSDTGDITFVMIAALEYDLTVTYAGSSNHFMISPQNNFYQLKFLTAAVADNSIGTCVYANGNTHSGIARPDIGNITFMFSYQDTCGTTVAIDYYVVDNDLGTTLYHYQLTPVTTGIYVNNYTVSNVRGKSYRWWQNSTRDV